eukprot:TRINITY_DN10148_c1_g1_i2.p1 TRINITY_DN10148_c1_g1~~TRINITY_DN10148_c1_g1_i2.p1  ORF type:complete len:631 (+),score=175.43 TRINITY_DN10148_c1_g1_i2:69-1895(+)
MGKSKNRSKRARSTEPGRTLKATKRCSSSDSKSWVQQDVAIIPTKLKDLEGKVKAKDGEIEALQQLLDTKNKCSAKQAKLLKKKQAEDKKQLAKLAEKMDAKETEVASVQNNMQTLEEKNSGLQSEIESLQAKLKQSALETKSSAKLIKTLKKEKTQLTSQLTSESTKGQEAAADLKAQLDAAQEQVQILQASDKEATAQSSTNSQLMTRIAELEVELAKVVKQHEKSKSTSEHLALKLEKSEGLGTALTEKLNTTEHLLRENEEKAESEIEELTRKVEVLQHSHESHVQLKEKMTETIGELERLRDQNKKLQAENENYADELAVIKDAFEDSNNQLASKSELVETTEQMYNEASKAVNDLKELKKSCEKKDRRLDANKKEVQELKRTIETLAQDKADRDERIRELLESKRTNVDDLVQEDLVERQRVRSAVSVESARFATNNVRLSCVSLASPHSTADPVDLEGTPHSQKSILKKSHQRSRSRNRVSPPDIDYDIPQVHTPKHNTAPAIYAQQPTRTDKDNYKAALDMQVSQKRALSQSSSRRRELSERRNSTNGDFFKFGVAGSGAPIRDQNNDVITNVTYTRSTNYLPVDHPMSTKKNKRITRHF